MAPVIKRSERRILWASAILLGIALVIGAGMVWWINRSIARLTRYADSVTDNKPVPLPELGSSELRKLASHYLRKEYAGHTLQPTALVHEAYFKLIDQREVQWQNRAHFFGVAAQLMRRILIDHARVKKAAKRGGSQAIVSFDEVLHWTQEEGPDLVPPYRKIDEICRPTRL